MAIGYCIQRGVIDEKHPIRFVGRIAKYRNDDVPLLASGELGLIVADSLDLGGRCTLRIESVG